MDQKTLKVITSAQSFGYGPSSKLITIIKELRRADGYNFQVDFVGSSISLTYVSQNKKYLDDIFDEQKQFDLRKYDYAISVMDPYLAIKAAILKMPVIYVDSLFWFWKWNNENLPKLDNIVEKLKSNRDINRLAELLEEVGPHELQYLAHRFADYSIVQTFGQNELADDNNVRRKIQVLFVNPIIDRTLYKEDSKKDTILISLSGMISPLVNNEQALKYVKLVCNLFSSWSEKIDKNINIILTANPDVINKIDFDTARIKSVSMSNEEILNTLNRSIICFAPVGITFLYEALYYNVPIVFLPEQHDGHYANYLRLLKPGQTIKSLREVFPEMLFNTRVEREVNKDSNGELLLIQKLVDENYQGTGKVVESMKKELMKLDSVLLNSNEIKRMSRNQKQQFLTNKNFPFSDFLTKFLNSHFP